MGNGASAASFGGQSPDVQNFDVKNVRDIVYDQVVDDGNSGATPTTDWTTGAIHKVTLNVNATFTFTAPIGVARLMLRLIQGTGGQTATWPASVKWAGAAAPTLSTGAAAVDIVTFMWDGTNYWGVASLNFG
jgi:hypothetical protein